jgi:hypothetical protein
MTGSDDSVGCFEVTNYMSGLNLESSKKPVIGLASQFSPVHTTVSSTDHFEIVLPFMPRCSKVFQKDFMYFLFSLCMLYVFPSLIPPALIVTMLGEGYCRLRFNAVQSGKYLLTFGGTCWFLPFPANGSIRLFQNIGIYP